MIDSDVQRRILDAEIKAAIATENVEAAVEVSDRADVRRLEQEVLVALTIARQAYSSLLAAQPLQARHLSETLLATYERFRDERAFPNLTEFLGSFDRPRR
jgi:hypothetical protein